MLLTVVSGPGRRAVFRARRKLLTFSRGYNKQFHFMDLSSSQHNSNHLFTTPNYPVLSSATLKFSYSGPQTLSKKNTS